MIDINVEENKTPEKIEKNSKTIPNNNFNNSRFSPEWSKTNLSKYSITHPDLNKL